MSIYILSDIDFSIFYEYKDLNFLLNKLNNMKGLTGNLYYNKNNNLYNYFFMYNYKKYNFNFSIYVESIILKNDFLNFENKRIEYGIKYPNELNIFKSCKLFLYKKMELVKENQIEYVKLREELKFLKHTYFKKIKNITRNEWIGEINTDFFIMQN
jgi:hypothetical protein